MPPLNSSFSWVVGLDLSLTGTGIIVLDDLGEIVSKNLVKSKPDGDKPVDETLRLVKLADSIVELVPEGVRLVNIEQIAFAVNRGNHSAVVALNHMVRERLVEKALAFTLTAPTTLKKYVSSSGTAHKELMLMETYDRWGVKFTDNNLCDAYGLAQLALVVSGLKEPKNDYERETKKKLLKQVY